MTQRIADTLAEAEEYITKFAADTEESKGSATGRTPAGRDPSSLTKKSNLERLLLPQWLAQPCLCLTWS